MWIVWLEQCSVMGCRTAAQAIWLKVMSRPSLSISVVIHLGLALEISATSKTLKCYMSDSFESFLLKALDFIKVISRLL